MAEQTAAFPFSIEGFNQLSSRQKVGAMLAVAFAVALLVGAWMWTREPSYSVLFSNLSDKDGGQIITALQQQNIPYKFSEGGGAILVPANQVHDVRLRLASQGLPKGGQVGFELMENLKLGSTQFAEQIAYQRGLEGELARTIESLAAVSGARVHLAIPKQTFFLRDEQKPSASVLVSLRPGRVLDAAQVAGIVHLVSSSVPQLAPADVSVIDQDGNLISQQSDPTKNAGLDPSQIKFLHELEASYVKRIEALLAPIVGADNVRAQVTADVDFSQTEQVAETYKPNSAPENAIRSQQTAESSSTTANAIGVPGALTNQPPVPATAPITTPPAGAPPGTANASIGYNAPVNFNKNSTINYEVDKTVLHTKGVPGTIRRLSVGVVVNHKKGAEKDGKPGKPIPLTDAELKQLTALAREAVGFNQERGDSVNVANVAFAATEKEIVPELPFWKNPDVIAFAGEAVKYLVFAVIVYLLWTKIFRALFEMFATAAKRIEIEQATQAEKAQEALLHPHQGPSYDTKLQQARDLAKQDPKIVANVIKEWVGGNEPR
ncbi:MAG: flagellar basal-body MS-ring/collar protein FliF [Rhodocyclaceae bacterium]|nr:flagellar basal-body MS-ring/collar protein FliF [Rhodocyclaceae bacterium]